MKYLISILTIFATLICNAQTIKIGDNLKTTFKKTDSLYYFKAPHLTDWIEGKNMMLIGEKSNPNDCDFLFIALHDTTLIGILKTTLPNSFIFDTEGKSVLTTESQFFILPEWVVKGNTKISPTDRTIYNIFDEFYEETMQADEGHLLKKTITKYQQFKTDTALANRHIALLFDDYQKIISETSAKDEKPPASICVSLMKKLSGECLAVYKSIPAIVCVYMGEALLNAGMKDIARKHFKMALQFYPNSIPVLVYNYQLEQNPVRKKEKLKNLKKKHAKHWMVKDL